MKNEKVLDNNDIQIPIDLNIASEQSLNKKEENDFDFIIKKHYNEFLFFICIIFIFCFSLHSESKGYNLLSLMRTIKSNLGIKDRIDKKCYELEPMHLFELRLNNTPIVLCDNNKTNQNHICYKNPFEKYLYYKKGISCIMKNIIIDPSKSSHTNIIYKGLVDPIYRGFPIINNGFFNMKCESKNDINDYNSLYYFYMDSWNYNYNQEEEITELNPGKTIFFLSRNQDSPNLYHGTSELINTVAMMKLLNLKPEDIQIIFLESMTINDDPIYDLYENIISRGGEPINIRNVKKKFIVSSAVHVPINVDSPVFMNLNFPDCGQKSGRIFEELNNLIDKYMNIQTYEDKFITDNETYYYPKSVIDSYNSKTEFKKYITIQWRKAWPKGRKGQYRILGNGPEIAEKLANALPKNFLVRLIDTAGMPIREQISLMKKTDYLVGIHGAGLSLAIFMSNKSILHEVLPEKNMPVLTFLSSMSGHKTYSDILRSTKRDIDGNEYIFFKEGHFVRKVLSHMRENNYFLKN